MIEFKAKGILLMVKKISVRDIRCMLRIHKKIRNLVDECHRKFARWLCENYHVILLPEFKTKDMVKRGSFRKIHSKTARQMMTWSHYRFRQYLLHKSREYPWCARSSSALRSIPAKLVDVVE